MTDDETIFTKIVEALYDANIDEVVKLVNENEFDVNFRDVTHDLQTLLMRTCYVELETSQIQRVFEAFFEQSPDVNIKDSWGRTVLMHACIANKPCIIEGLLEYEPTDVTVIDFEGNSALSYALQYSDLYTLEDILSHSSGPKLLDVHNAKGQSPYQIAQEKQDAAILRLFESYRSQSLGRQPRNRKPRCRDVIRLPMVSYSPTRDVHPLKLAYGKDVRTEKLLKSFQGIQLSKSASSPRLRENLLTLKITSKTGGNSAEKCDSAPVRRSNPHIGRDQMASSLPLSSPRLERLCHKQNCLKSGLNYPLNPDNKSQFPPVKGKDDDDKTFETECGGQFRKQRRGSISLPDLRNMSGYLVASGASTPNTGSGANTPDAYASCSEDDDVFAQSYPNATKSQHTKPMIKKHNRLERQCTLPEINSGLVSLSGSRNSLGLTPLARQQRKYSTSDDQIHRATVKQDVR